MWVTQMQAHTTLTVTNCVITVGLYYEPVVFTQMFSHTPEKRRETHPVMVSLVCHSRL